MAIGNYLARHLGYKHRPTQILFFFPFLPLLFSWAPLPPSPRRTCSCFSPLNLIRRLEILARSTQVTAPCLTVAYSFPLFFFPFLLQFLVPSSFSVLSLVLNLVIL